MVAFAAGLVELDDDLVAVEGDASVLRFNVHRVARFLARLWRKDHAGGAALTEKNRAFGEHLACWQHEEVAILHGDGSRANQAGDDLTHLAEVGLLAPNSLHDGFEFHGRVIRTAHELQHRFFGVHAWFADWCSRPAKKGMSCFLRLTIPGRSKIYGGVLGEYVMP